MSDLNLLRISTPFITLGVLAILLLQPGHKAAGTLRFDPRAHIERGDRVEKRYAAYSERLAKHYAALTAAIKEQAPDLLVHLQPSKPILHGYQILPPISAGASGEKHVHTKPVAYSWPWTDRLIDTELREIAHSEAELRRAADTTSGDRKSILEILAVGYRQQSHRLRNIHAHIQYNRLWQAAIAADRSGYDRETALLGKIIERQAIIDRLTRAHAGLARSDAAFDAPLGIAQLNGSLRKRGALLTERIDRAIGQVQTPAFVRILNSNNDWIFHVPLLTDIENREYVRAVTETIENTWRLEDGGNSYRVRLEVTHVSGDALYLDKDQPAAGQVIDLRRHLKRFPSQVAVLTTGARTTHVQDYAIVLGPHPIAPQVLAHEFGHILGFRDRYVRGYKDLGEHGFQVIELVADHKDIMAATSHGLVQRDHFLRLAERRAQPVSGTRKISAGKISIQQSSADPA